MNGQQLLIWTHSSVKNEQPIYMLKDVAVFSIFRRSAEHPIYRIEKRPKMAAKQQQYSVIGMDGRILKRGDDLRQVLQVLEKKLIRAVD